MSSVRGEPNLSMELVNHLQRHAVSMECELENWKKEVKAAREKYYDLNYYTTLQLLTLRKVLGDVQKKSAQFCTHSVLALLQSISTEVSSTCVKKTVEHALEQRTRFHSEATQPNTPVPNVKTANNGAGVEENQDSKLETTLHCSETVVTTEHVTPKSVDMPVTKLEELSDEQKNFIVTIKNHYGYSTNLLLKAFDECGNDATQYDIEHWCNDNVDEFEFDLSDGEDNCFGADDDSILNDDSSDDSDSDESVDECLNSLSGIFYEI